MAGNPIERKLKEINRRTQALDDRINSLAVDLAREIIDAMAQNLERDDQDRILANTKNIAIIAQIEKIYQRFIAQEVEPALVRQVVDGLNAVLSFNTDYYSQFGKDKARYAATRTDVKNTIRDRLGFGNKTRLKPGGFMATMLSDNTVATQIKDFSLQEAIKGTGFNSFRRGLQQMIRGDRQRLGAFQRHFKTYAYDVLVNIDRQDSVLTAKALDLKYFIYSGTLIETSRDFCIARAGRVFTREQAQDWERDPWIQKNLRKGYIASYDPIIDLGLFGCRHTAQFISEEYAKKLLQEQERQPTSKTQVSENVQEPKKKEEAKPIEKPKPKRAPRPPREKEPETSFLKEGLVELNKAILQKNVLVRVGHKDRKYNGWNTDSMDVSAKRGFEEIKRITGWDEKDILSLVGGFPTPDAKIKSLKVNMGDDYSGNGYYTIGVDLETDQYRIQRDLVPRPNGAWVVENHYMRVYDNDAAKKHKNIGLKLFKNQVQGMVKKGVDWMEVLAAGNPGSKDWNGYNTWARFGYQMDPDSARNFRSQMKYKGRTENGLMELMSTEEGAKWWRANGWSFNGEFSLRPKSRNIDAFNKYLESKGFKFRVKQRSR